MEEQTCAPVAEPGLGAAYVVGRLRDLREWAAYLDHSLNRDFEWESGKVELLEGMVSSRVLQDARQHAEALFRSLRELTRQAEGVAYEREAAGR